jgi:phage baseplate assembly protein gpV
MAALGSLVVKLALEYAEYTQGLDKSSQEALKFAQGAQRSFDQAASSSKEFFVGMATGAVQAAATFLTVRAAIDGLTASIDTLEKLDDMAQKTGSSVENLSRIQKTVQAFGGDFNSVDTAISKLAKGMATVDSDTNKANNALKALGISSRDTAGNLRDPSEVMIDIAKQLQNYSDGAGKSALATDLFGKSGAEMLPVLNDIADNVDRFAGVSAEAAAQATAFKDQVGLLKVESSELYESLAIGLLPAFTDIAKSMADAAKQGGIFQGILAGIGALSKNMFNTDRLLPQDQKIVARLQEIRGAMDGILEKRKSWYMPANYADGELQSLNLEAIALQKELALLQDVSKEKAKPDSKPQLNYLSGNDAAAKAAAQKIESLNDASRKYLVTLQTETLGVGANTIQTKMLAAAKQAAITPSKALAAEIMTQAQAWAKLTQFQEDATTEFAALQEREDAFLQATNNITDYARATDNANESAQFEIDLMGKSAVEREVAIAQRKAELELKKQILTITDQVSQADDRAALIEEANAIGQRAIAAARVQALAKSTNDEWTRIGQTIEQTGKNAFVQFAAHGTSAMKSIGQAIKLSIIDMIFQLTARKWMIQLEASLASSMASGAANAAGSAISGGGSMLGGIGSLFGSSAGAGAGAASTAGMAGFMSGAAAAMPVVAAWLATGALASSFGAGKKIFGIKGDSFLTTLFPIVGILAGLFGKGPKQYGPQLLNGNFTDTGFSGNFQADWTRKVGLFGGKKKGTTDFAIGQDQVDSLNLTVTSITDVFDGLIKTTGDADRSLTGWTFNVRRQIDTEEQQKQLTDDLANSIGQKLVPELTALQLKGETLADTASRAQQEFQLMTAAIDLTGQSFGATGLASLGLRDSLVQLLGGIQNAGSVLQPFFDNFYTDAERVASTGRLMNAELNKLGVTVIPTTREQFRALVEAQDLSTDSGQKMFAALVQLAPAFATVTDAIGKAADDAAAEAKRIADSIQLLTTDAFATLFDYTKYIRLAANAGVTAAQPAGPVFQAPAPVFRPSFAVGTNEVPNDMAANIHRGERIIPAADNRELMRRLNSPSASNEALAAEIRQLRAELKAQNLAIAKNTSRTAKILDTWDGNGQPPVRS